MPRKIKSNNNSSPELLASVNPDNMSLKNEFLNYLKSIGRSDGTIKGYDNDLDGFFCWILLNANNKNFTDVTKRDIINYQNHLIYDNKNSPARVRRIKAAISSMSNFIEAILDEEPEYKDFRKIVSKIESPPLEPVQEKTVFSDEDVESLLQYLSDTKEYEKACCVALAAYGGRRKAELLRFKVSDFDKHHIVCDGALYESSPILTKGNKIINCYTLKKKFDPYLNAWIKERKRLGIESEWLFPNRNNLEEARKIETLNSWAMSFSRIVKKDFYWHALRHYSATSYVRAGLPDSVIVEIFSWATADMLAIYDDTGKEEKIAMYFKNGDIDIPETKGIGDI